MGTLLKSNEFHHGEIRNKCKLIPGVNDGNVIKLKSIKIEKTTSEENPEIELFSNKIRKLVSEIIPEIVDEWGKVNGLFKYFSEDGLKNIVTGAESLSDKMLISGLLMNERFSDKESKTYAPFSDDEKLGYIRELFVSEFKDKIEEILNTNSLNNALVINLFKY